MTDGVLIHDFGDDGFTIMENGEIRSSPNPLGVTQVYIVVHRRPHVGPTVYGFTDPDRAVEWARTKAQRHAASRGGCKIYDRSVDGYLYYASFSDGSDEIWAIERRLDDPEADE